MDHVLQPTSQELLADGKVLLKEKRTVQMNSGSVWRDLLEGVGVLSKAVLAQGLKSFTSRPAPGFLLSHPPSSHLPGPPLPSLVTLSPPSLPAMPPDSCLGKEWEGGGGGAGRMHSPSPGAGAAGPTVFRFLPRHVARNWVFQGQGRLGLLLFTLLEPSVSWWTSQIMS